jgi:YHS domain-containing protein
MKSRWLVVPLGLAMLIAAKGFSAAEKETEKKEFKATCPVSGKPATEDHVVTLKNGDKVYFCCDNCPKEFKADRKKYTIKVNRQLLETGQIVQVACPVTGKPINKDDTVETGNAKVSFCCEKCLAKYNEAADDDAKLKMLFSGAAMKRGFTHQTMCPVSGKPIDPQYSVDYKGEKVYFCCPNCPAAFEKDPEKYAAKVPQLNKKGAGKDTKAEQN